MVFYEVSPRNEWYVAGSFSVVFCARVLNYFTAVARLTQKDLTLQYL
jgi:hypothetical protein